MKNNKKKVDATKLYEVGQRLILQMIKSERGNMPIARTEEGVICLISREKKGFFQYLSSWTCKIVTVYENKLIVEPVRLEETAEKAARDVTKKVQQAFGQQKPERRQRQRKSYQYKSKAEHMTQAEIEAEGDWPEHDALNQEW